MEKNTKSHKQNSYTEIDLRTHSFKGDFYQILPLRAQETPHLEKAVSVREPEGMEDFKSTRVPKSTKRSSYYLTETEAEITGQLQVCNRSTVLI